jgi:hypothetical protein
VTEGTPWAEFDALIEVLPWGRNVYTIIRLEKALETAAKVAGTRRVEGTIDDVPVNVGVNRADVLPDAFMYAGKGLQRRQVMWSPVACAPLTPMKFRSRTMFTAHWPMPIAWTPSSASSPPIDGVCCNPSRTPQGQRPASSASRPCCGPCRPTDQRPSWVDTSRRETRTASARYEVARRRGVGPRDGRSPCSVAPRSTRQPR